jgi:hypothetical protein
VVGDRLVTKNFGTGTVGFMPAEDRSICHPTAVCVLPGTEISFDDKVNVVAGIYKTGSAMLDDNVAIFRQINKDDPHKHHDALEFPSGEVVLLTMVKAGQCARVLQLPAAPKTETERKEQDRLEIVA